MTGRVQVPPLPDEDIERACQAFFERSARSGEVISLWRAVPESAKVRYRAAMTAAVQALRRTSDPAVQAYWAGRMKGHELRAYTEGWQAALAHVRGLAYSAQTKAGASPAEGAGGWRALANLVAQLDEALADYGDPEWDGPGVRAARAGFEDGYRAGREEPE